MPTSLLSYVVNDYIYVQFTVFHITYIIHDLEKNTSPSYIALVSVDPRVISQSEWASWVTISGGVL